MGWNFKKKIKKTFNKRAKSLFFNAPIPFTGDPMSDQLLSQTSAARNVTDPFWKKIGHGIKDNIEGWNQPDMGEGGDGYEYDFEMPEAYVPPESKEAIAQEVPKEPISVGDDSTDKKKRGLAANIKTTPQGLAKKSKSKKKTLGGF